MMGFVCRKSIVKIKVDEQKANHEDKPMSQKKLHPGQETPASGQYAITGPRGGKTGEERTSVKGKPLPPTPKAGQEYKLVDRTRNKSGQGR